MFWIAFLVFANVATVTLLWAVLTYGMPKRIRQAAEANGVRLDGSISDKRTSIENKEVRNVVWTTVAFVIPFMVLLNFMLLYTHYRITPLSYAVEAFENYSWDDRKWKNRLEGAETQNLSARYHAWRQENGIAGQTPFFRLIAGWPFALTCFSMISIFMFFVAGGVYLAGLKRIEPKIQERHRKYLQYDMRERHELIESPNRKRVEPIRECLT